jgi:DNA-binding IclR family transcriptional regulator
LQAVQEKPKTRREGAGRRNDAEGTQCLDRAIAILMKLASQSPVGCRLIDIAGATGVTRPTVHRILKKLTLVGLVVQERGTHLYKLGAFAHAIEAGAAQSVLADISGASLARIAAETGQTALLESRSGRFCVCSNRVDGADSEILRNPAVGQIGRGGLLGPSAGSIAILAGLYDEQIDDILFDNEWMISRYAGIELDTYRSLIEQTRENGFCYTRGEFVSEVSGVAAAIPAPKGQAFAALSIVGSMSSIIPSVARQIAKILAEEAEVVAKQLALRFPAYTPLHTAAARR